MAEMVENTANTAENAIKCSNCIYFDQSVYVDIKNFGVCNQLRKVTFRDLSSSTRRLVDYLDPNFAYDLNTDEHNSVIANFLVGHNFYCKSFKAKQKKVNK